MGLRCRLGPTDPGLEARRRQARQVAIAITLGIALGVLASTVQLLPEIQNQWGEDHRFFVSVAQRWVDTGVVYLTNQLVSPYEARTAFDVL